MSVLDKIKGLLVDFNASFRDVLSNNKFILFHYEDKRTQVIFTLPTGEKGINLAALPVDIDKKIGKVIKDSEKGTLFANKDTDALSGEVDATINKTDNLRLLDFFHDKIPSEDFLILSVAVFIRDKFKKGSMEEVSFLRQQLSQTYGRKAYDISNLCTANYFETFLMPLFDEMSKQKEFTIEQYKKTYIRLINDFPVALFINAFISKKEVEERIKNKIAIVKKNGIPYLNIHGIGKRNIMTIQNVISKLRKNKDYTTKKIELDEFIIIVRLRFD